MNITMLDHFYSIVCMVHTVRIVASLSKQYHVHNTSFIAFTLSTLRTRTVTYANSVDPYKAAHREPSHQDTLCLSRYDR